MTPAQIDMCYILVLLALMLVAAFFEQPYFLAVVSVLVLVKQLGRINTTLRSKQ